MDLADLLLGELLYTWTLPSTSSIAALGELPGLGGPREHGLPWLLCLVIYVHYQDGLAGDFDFEMADDDKKDDRGSYIPVWDGRADALREFKRSVTWWLSSIDLTKTTKFNLAARFAMRQKGSAKLRALEFEPKDLEYIPAVMDTDLDENEYEVTPAVYDAGIQKILAAWEDMVGRTATDRKGELRERFYLNLKGG